MMGDKPIPVTKGPGSLWTGWTKTLKAAFEQLESDAEGLKLRLKYPTRPGVPAAYQASRIFVPETASFLLDTEQDGVSSNLVNFVVRDGATYDIPIVFPGPGVFAMKHLEVAVTQRLFSPDYRAALELPLVSLAQPFVDVNFTTKFSLFPVQPTHLTGAQEISGTPAVNFFWNIIESKSGRKLSDDLMSHLMLLPRTHMFTRFPGGGGFANQPWMHDGGLLRMDVPWLIERDGQLNFQWRPINPVLQFDSSIAGNAAAIGLPWDDRENGVRNQQVRVSVEAHGYRYETEQDAMKRGATTK